MFFLAVLFSDAVHLLTTAAWCVAFSDLESVVEEIRKDVVNRRCRVNIAEIESMALVLSQLSRSLAELKGQKQSSGFEDYAV